jgi:hypothetical protein
MKNLVFLPIVFLISLQGSVAQSVYGALNQFLSQEFFTEYLELRDRAEESVRQFKYIQHKYPEEDVMDVMHAYDAAAKYYNSVILNIKADLLNKEKRRYMTMFPDDFAKKTEADLYKAKEFYENTFQKEIIRVTDGEITGMAFLALMPKIIGYAKSAFAIYKKIRKQMDKFNNEILDKHLVKKYSFKTWDEIE